MSRSTKRTFYKQFDTGQDVKGDFLLKCFIESCVLRFVNYIFVNHRVAVTHCSRLLNPLDHPTPFRKPTILHQNCSPQTHPTPPPTLLKLFVINYKKNL